ncbi:MAG: methyltransferase domain-containing protein [Burkholderiales bacterium]|nr:methyltransferase domain-containing protein [Burkholderiales bacterium]
MPAEDDYTPALGYQWLTPMYDFAIATLTREKRWREFLLRQIAPAAGDRILDVGCGTGSLALMLKDTAPGADVLGLDPDPAVLARAKAKSERKKLAIQWHNTFLTSEIVRKLRPVSKVVSSLVLHQTPLVQKQEILDRAHQVLAPGGELHIADYGLQASKIMRCLFRLTVQAVDGIEDTQPNADGVLTALIENAGFTDVSVESVVPTLTGSISLYRATRERL